MLQKTLESPLDYQEIQPVNTKGNQSWIFIGRTDAEAETPILWPPNAKNWLTGKDPDAGKIEGRRRRGQLRMRRLDGITDSMDKSLSKLRSWWWTGKPGMLQSMGLQRVGHDCNWTELKSLYQFFFSPELSLCHPNFFSLSLVFLYVNNIIIGLNTGVSMGIDYNSRYCPTTWLLHWNWSWCLWSWCFNWNWSLILCLLVVFRLDLLSNYSH